MLSNTDDIEAIFNGLLKKYDTFVLSVNSSPKSYSMEEMQSLLKKHG